MLDQDNNFYLISFNILISCLLDNVRISQREVSCLSLLGVKGLTETFFYDSLYPMLHVQFWYLSSISWTNWQRSEESVVSHSFLSLIRLVDLLKDRYSRVWIKCLDDYHHSTFVMNQTRAMLQIHVPLNPVGLLHFFCIRSGIHKPWKEKKACVHCTYIQKTKRARFFKEQMRLSNRLIIIQHIWKKNIVLSTL